jgi:hypothetical protein
MGQGDADEEGMQLYRAVSQGELYDITLFDGFRPGPGCMETKLFATSAVHAAFFAREILYPLDNKPLTIVEVTIPHALEAVVKFLMPTDSATVESCSSESWRRC